MDHCAPEVLDPPLLVGPVRLVRVHHDDGLPVPDQDRLGVPQPGSVQGEAADQGADGSGAAPERLKVDILVNFVGFKWKF